MTRQLDPTTDHALSTLDPAQPTLTDAQQDRAAATLAAILATDPATAAPATTRPAMVRPARRRLGRLASLGAVAAATVALLATPNLLGGDTAYASWTSRPTPVLSEPAQQIGEACRAFLTDTTPTDAEIKAMTASGDTGWVGRKDIETAKVYIAERRGDWQFVLLGSADGVEGTCLFTPAGPIARFFGAGYGNGAGSLGRTDVAPPTSTGMAVTTLGGSSTNGDAFQYVSGLVGSQVRSVTVTTPTRRVEASVADGRFAAWWPVPTPKGADGDPLEDVTFTVTLLDGTVVPDLTGHVS